MKETKCPEGLVYIKPETEGYIRVIRGKGFSYHLSDGKKIDDINTINRIKSLSIPPFWKKVWICKNPKGHLQATGYDAKKRKQYLYHPEWVAYRQLAKFTKLKEFGLVIPHIREYCHRLLDRTGWQKEKVMALVVQMMDEYHIRIGNEFYKNQNETFGLTTLRRKHLDFEKGVGKLEYKAKSGKYRKIRMDNNQLINLVKRCSELPGYEIFTYRNDEGRFEDVSSQDVNDFLHRVAGNQFSSKDFRTWGGTSKVVEKEKEARFIIKRNTKKKLEPTLVKLVASELGNTQAVCKEYYIHPKVLSSVVSGKAEKFRKYNPDGIKSTHLRLLSISEKVALGIINAKD